MTRVQKRRLRVPRAFPAGNRHRAGRAEVKPREIFARAGARSWCRDEAPAGRCRFGGVFEAKAGGPAFSTRTDSAEPSALTLISRSAKPVTPSAMPACGDCSQEAVGRIPG